jgi:1-acyl-sn-glycerol-3-phosphate acyltransferase
VKDVSERIESLGHASSWTQRLPKSRREQAPHLRLVYSAPNLDPVLTRRDPAFIRRIFPLMTTVVDRYFRTEVEGVENLSDRACMIVSTHNGGIATPDIHCLLVAYWRRFGLETPGYGLMHQAAFHIPGLGPFLTRVGAIPANRRSAGIALRAGFPLLVCPGGDVDSLKPFRDRHRICFGRRRGFIRLAIREQVPIIPSVSVGAHETMFVLNDGRRMAERIGLSKIFRIKSVPLVLSFPFGLTPAGIFSIPLPSKIRIRVLPRIELHEPPGAADDDAVVERCFEHVRRAMQDALDDLASRRRRVFFG